MFSLELLKANLENGIRKRVSITWEAMNCIALRHKTTVTSIIESSAEGDYFYTTKVPSSETEKEACEIRNDGESEQAERTIYTDQEKDEYIYLLRVARAEKTNKSMSGRSTRMSPLRLGSILLPRICIMKSGTMKKIRRLNSCHGYVL